MKRRNFLASFFMVPFVARLKSPPHSFSGHISGFYFTNAILPTEERQKIITKLKEGDPFLSHFSASDYGHLHHGEELKTIKSKTPSRCTLSGSVTLEHSKNSRR